MATPTQHAVCSASSSERWLHCTAAPRYEEQFPEGTSEYAEEGRLAHSVCELAGAKRFGKITSRKFTSEVNKLKKTERLWKDEMLKTSDFYAQYLWEKSMQFPEKPVVNFEVSVDLSDYVPEGFGTCDSIMIGGDTLHITDYKHGEGVPVSPIENSQMRLYALGALKLYYPLFGDAIRFVSTAIVQPRITEDVMEDRITVEELREWGESIKPAAMKAYYGMGEFLPGDWCRFCRGKAQCRARAEKFSAFNDFKDCIPAGKLPASDRAELEDRALYNEPVPDNILTDAEVAKLLVDAAGLVKWYEDLKDYALQAVLSGKMIPGWKAVAGRSVRAFSDADKAFETIKQAGYEDAMLYERKPKSLSELEKMIGKKAFADLVGSLIVKPMGNPTLVPESDKREPYNSAAADFQGVGK